MSKNSPHTDELRVQTPLGTLVAGITPDAEYPGIYIDIQDTPSKIMFPLNHAEYDPERNTIISRIWGDARQEDYTDRIDHVGLKEVFKHVADEQETVLHDQSPIAYICAPFSADTPEGIQKNIENAKKYGRFALSKGYAPFIAHVAIGGFLDETNEEERNIGLQMDMRFIDNCDELWVFGDYISKGMELEMQHCRNAHIPIRYFSDTLNEEDFEMT